MIMKVWNMCVMMVKTSSPRLTHTFLAWSLSSIWPRSLPLAWAILFPDTRFPTITDAGPISEEEEEEEDNMRRRNQKHTEAQWSLWNIISYSTWLFLPRFGQVGDAGVRTHEHVAGVQRPLQEQLLGLRQVDATQRSLGQSVGGHQSQAVHPHLVDTVYRLETTRKFENLHILLFDTFSEFVLVSERLIQQVSAWNTIYKSAITGNSICFHSVNKCFASSPSSVRPATSRLSLQINRQADELNGKISPRESATVKE